MFCPAPASKSMPVEAIRTCRVLHCGYPTGELLIFDVTGWIIFTLSFSVRVQVGNQ